MFCVSRAVSIFIYKVYTCVHCRDMFCAGRVPEEDLKRTMQACGGCIQSTVASLEKDDKVLGTCALFEEKQIGGDRYVGLIASLDTTSLSRGYSWTISYTRCSIFSPFIAISLRWVAGLTETFPFRPDSGPYMSLLTVSSHLKLVRSLVSLGQAKNLLFPVSMLQNTFPCLNSYS